MADVNVMDLFRLDDRVAIVTGGSKGLGKQMALAFAQAGATTVICSRHGDEAEAVASEIAKDTGQESVGQQVDVTNWDEINGLVTETAKRYGRLDVVVNNAGINVRHPIEDFPEDDFDRMIDINIKGVWLGCKAAAGVMKPQGSGSVINTASVLSTVGLSERSVYSTTKASLIGMTRTLGVEWAPSGVRCNALCPGPFLTEINKPLEDKPEVVKGLLSLNAMNRWAELHEIRGSALFLASDASTFVTGASLYVDGGWAAK